MHNYEEGFGDALCPNLTTQDGSLFNKYSEIQTVTQNDVAQIVEGQLTHHLGCLTETLKRELVPLISQTENQINLPPPHSIPRVGDHTPQSSSPSGLQFPLLAHQMVP